MRGHTELIELRHHRRVPEAGVLIEVAQRRSEPSGHMLLTVDPCEPIGRLDLRCVVGLEVVVFAYDNAPQQRAVRLLCAACVAAGAKAVIGLQYTGWDDAQPLHEVLFTHRQQQEVA